MQEAKLIALDSLKGCAIIRPHGSEEIALIKKFSERVNHFEIPTADVEPLRPWIPCRERMPESEGRYLVYDSVSKAQFVTQYWGDGTWRTVRAEITHWMPLPDDPEGSGEDD